MIVYNVIRDMNSKFSKVGIDKNIKISILIIETSNEILIKLNHQLFENVNRWSMII